MRWNIGIAVFGRWNAADVIVAVLNMQIAGRVVLTLLQLPSEEFGVELAGAGHVGSVEIGPAERAVRVLRPDSAVFLGLPDAERRACRILHDGHASNIHYVERRRNDIASQLAGA